VGPRAGLDRRGKSRPLPGFDPRTVQPVVSRYTDRDTGPTYRMGICSKGRIRENLKGYIAEDEEEK
jgi:hypothetical protein